MVPAPDGLFGAEHAVAMAAAPFWPQSPCCCRVASLHRLQLNSTSARSWGVAGDANRPGYAMQNPGYLSTRLKEDNA